jgi:hypothetical protein
MLLLFPAFGLIEMAWTLVALTFVLMLTNAATYVRHSETKSAIQAAVCTLNLALLFAFAVITTFWRNSLAVSSNPDLGITPMLWSALALVLVIVAFTFSTTHWRANPLTCVSLLCACFGTASLFFEVLVLRLSVNAPSLFWLPSAAGWSRLLAMVSFAVLLLFSAIMGASALLDRRPARLSDGGDF